MPRHVIVDGSNIATEGRSMPSLKQLNEAVTAFMQEFPDDVITVVVDATFGHRIDPSEVPEFDEAVAHNELVAPPAGAIGRGDSFILSIAHKTKGSILTNDSYQEFHGEYPWVFDEGRLIGGKPVPHVGWVFVLRTPVRGPVSRKSVKAGRSVNKNTGRVPRASKAANQPMPVPKAPPPGAMIGKSKPADDGRSTKADDGRSTKAERKGATKTSSPQPKPSDRRPAPAADDPLNDLMAFIDFVEHHPVASSVNAVVESYSSHGAYVTIGEVRGYVPLRLMSDPPARSARELGKVGDAVTLVVHSFTPSRRSIDLAVPAAAQKVGVPPPTVPVEPHTAETAVIAQATVIAETGTDGGSDAPAKPASTRKRAAKKAAAAPDRTAPDAGSDTEPQRAVAGDGQPTEQAAPRRAAKKASASRAKKAPADASAAPARVRKTASKRASAAEAAPEASMPEVSADAEVPKPSKRAAKKAAAAGAPTPAKKAASKAAATRAAAKKAEPAAAPSASVPEGDAPKPAKRVAAKKAAEPVAAPSASVPAAPASGPPDEAMPAKRTAKKTPAKKAPAKQAAKASPAAKKARASADDAVPQEKKARASGDDAVPQEKKPPAKRVAKKAATRDTGEASPRSRRAKATNAEQQATSSDV